LAPISSGTRLRTRLVAVEFGDEARQLRVLEVDALVGEWLAELCEQREAA